MPKEDSEDTKDSKDYEETKDSEDTKGKRGRYWSGRASSPKVPRGFRGNRPGKGPNFSVP